MAFLQKLRQALSPTAKKLQSVLGGMGGGQQPWGKSLVEALVLADVSLAVAERLVAQLPRKIKNSQEATAELAKAIGALLQPAERSLHDLLTVDDHSIRPKVILMVGVNGTGKTTSLSKLAKLAAENGARPLLVAADSFRAAGVEQLQLWAKKLSIDFFAGSGTTDPAAIAFSAYHHAVNHGHHLVLIDTAGRLHTNKNLMAELEKIIRVLQKIDPALPQDVILNLDATTGQNALAQVDLFGASVPLSGLIITKMDGTAKGGIVVSIINRKPLPLYALGVGEKPDDLDQFSAKDFATSLVGYQPD